MKNNPSVEKTFFCILGGEQISPISTLFHHSPARVYAHTTGVFAFLLSQVSHSPPNQLMFKSLTIHLEHCLRFTFCTTTKRNKFEDKKTHPKNKILVHFRRTR